MKRIDVRFVQEAEKLLVVLDPSQINSLVHAEEILRDVIAQRGLVTYEPLPTSNNNL